MQIINLFAFLSVIFRAATIMLQSLVLGGVVFSYVVSGRSEAEANPSEAKRACERLLRIAAIVLIMVQALYITCEAVLLVELSGFHLGEIAGASFFLAGIVSIGCGLLIVFVPYKAKHSAWVLIPLALGVIAAMVTTSHAASRLESRGVLITFTALHLVAVGCWIGGLPYLLLSLRAHPNPEAELRMLRRFSSVAMICVGVIAATGVGTCLYYFDSWSALYGTAYGVMMASKTALFAVLLLLGAVNRSIVNRNSKEDITSRLRYFVATEVGVAMAVILIAVSMTTQPPAIDLRAQRVDGATILDRMTPRWPRLHTPAVSELTPATRPLDKQAAAALPATYVPGEKIHTPNTPSDIAWSEYNHHWMGLLLLLIGIAAVLARTGRIPLAKQWPLLFILIGVFIFLRADPENWPLGPNGFWESFDEAEVLQHRMAVLLVIAFAIFEWRVQLGTSKWRYAPLVFPAVCVAGGMLLVTHTHSLNNIKEELLAELSHIPLALLAILAGWSRWLQFRLPKRDQAVVSWIWPLCFALMGTILLNYREA
ncbi:MAG TPA: CopD family protein [Terriglobales bacterium]|nr:CopD family protein [Terriglobales bacterium]